MHSFKQTDSSLNMHALIQTDRQFIKYIQTDRQFIKYTCTHLNRQTHALIQTDRQLLMVIELFKASFSRHIWRLSSRDVVLTLGGKIQRKKTRGSTSGSHCASLSLLALFLSQAFSLVSFPFTNLFLTLSLFLLVGLLKCRTAEKRQTGITGS